jgi:hypothetical protein
VALDALLCRSLDCNAAATFTLLGPLEYGDTATAADEIDLHGRIGIDETLAVVAFVEGPVGGNGTVIMDSDDNNAFSSAKAERTWTNAITTTSGRNGDGLGPHLLGYVTGPAQRYLRFRVTASADIGVVTVALTRDWPLTDLVA